MNIVLLHEPIPKGASKDAQDVCLQADMVAKALTDLGHTTRTLHFSLNLQNILDQLHAINPDIVFNLVESVADNGALIHMAPAILDILKMPYTGSRTDALFLTSNKLLAKRLLKASGIPTPDWVTRETIDEHRVHVNAPYIVKSVWEHASIGLTNDSIVIPENREQLLDEIIRREEDTGKTCFAERYVDGREFNLSLLENGHSIEFLPIAEMRFVNFPEGKWKILDYASKWETGSFEYSHTQRSFDLPDHDCSLLKKLTEIARKSWDIFGLRGYSRIDFRVDTYDEPWVLEINANPCISPNSGFVASAEEAGLHFNQIIERIVHASFTE
ncbi:MAG: D-alanine--D-alanine ligase family protein [bacterium]